MDKNVNLSVTQKQSHLFKFRTATILRSNTIADIISILCIFLFIYAAISKFIDYTKFRQQLGQSPILTTFADWFVWGVPSVEIIISILLAIPKFRNIGFFAFFSLMIMFSAYIVAITKFSEYIPCSCGGVLQNMSWNQHLLFNIAYVLLSILGIIITSSRKT